VPDPAPFDHSRAAAFEERFVGVLNAGALCLMTSLGHRVGLFDAMQTCRPRVVKRSRRAPASTSVTCANGWGRWSTVPPVLKSHILPLVPGLDERLKDGIRISTSAAGGAGR
jgi:hypothetical protein